MDETAPISHNERLSIPQLFGQNVRKYRRARKMTQEELSEKLEISQKHLSIIETGTQFASASLIERLCDVLNVAPGNLFGGSEDEVLKEVKSATNLILTAVLNETRQEFAVLSSEIDEIKQMLKNRREDF